VDITRKVSSLEITVKELKEKNKDIENSTQVMSDLFEDETSLQPFKTSDVSFTFSLCFALGMSLGFF
jgi:hypothetical protein